MSSCIICGTETDGRVCSSHDQDVVFEFHGSDPSALHDGRFYHGTVDGYADFGVFVDLSGSVTGLLHRSELDQRLESLDWEEGDDVFVQVKNVRDNGNVDLSWSIRQSEREFRGSLIQDGNEERERESAEDDEDADTGVTHRPTPEDFGDDDSDADDSTSDDSGSADTSGSESADTGEAEAADTTEAESADTSGSAAADTDESEATDTTEAESAGGDGSTAAATGETESADTSPEPTGEEERTRVSSLSESVGETVRLEGEITNARQTSGPTVFELRDETGTIDCAAFVEAGVRAYPGIEVGEIVRLDGEVERRRDELQVETAGLAALEGDDRETVEGRLQDAMRDRARPDAVRAPADHPALDDVTTDVLDAAEVITRAVLEERPIVVRHAATADGYVAGAALERATLPLIQEEHAESDAEYHFFDRRPLDGSVYDLNAATSDTTRMLSDRQRHGEQLPLVVLLGTGSTVESEDGLELLSVYGAERLVVDARAGDPAVADTVEAMVTTGTEPTPSGEPASLTTGALATTLAATVNPDEEGQLAHLPAVSYWTNTPEAFQSLAAEAGYDAERVTQLRDAVALEAFYQRYEDKRELIADILFGDNPELAAHVSSEFRQRLSRELETAAANIERHEVDGDTVRVLDADAFAHRYEFPSTNLLADALHREHGGRVVVLGDDDLYVRADEPVDVREVAATVAERVSDGGVTAAGVRDGRIEYVVGRRNAVRDAVVDAIV